MTSENIQTHHKYRIVVKYSIPILLSFVFLYVAFENINLKDVLHFISNVSLFWIVILVIVNLFPNYVRALRWKVILKSVKPDTSIKNLFSAIMVGYGINCLVPRLGEVSRAVLVGKWENLSRSSILATVIVERIFDIIFFALAVIISALFWTKDLYDKFPWLKNSVYISLSLMALLILIFYFMIRFQEKFSKIIVFLTGKVSKELAKKSVHIFEMIILGLGCLKGTGNYVFTIILSTVIMLLYAFGAYVGFYAIGMEQIKPVTYQMGWVLMSISSIGFVIPTPGGTGSYHAFTKSALVLLFGFGADISIAYAFLTHIISYFVSIFVAFLVYFINDEHYNIFKIAKNELDDS